MVNFKKIFNSSSVIYIAAFENIIVERVSKLAYVVGRCLLRQRLLEADMTQVELSETMGVKVQQINKYVNTHRHMSLQVAKNISVILNCSIDDLYEWKEVGNKE